MTSAQIKAQRVNVTGTVTDNSGPLIGVSIQIEGTSTGCITDVNGHYRLANVPSKGTLAYSSIGYQTQRVAVNGRTNINVTLEEDSRQLQEVIVVGYGVQRKSDLTGSVASVKVADALKNTPSGNASDALQGRMAGVSVLSGSGDPSNDNTIRVRGINSITAETGPLVVIDGFIGGSLKSLNPSDIASIEVLKDASATAVYGSRGANGVILVTTKSPEKNKLVVSFNGFINFKTVAKYPDVLSPYDYALLANEYGKEYFGGGDNYYYNAEQLEAFKSGKAGYKYSRNIFRDPAIVQNYEMSVAGGGEKTTFLASLRYEDNQGVIKKSNSSIYTWRLKVDSQIKRWLKAGLNFYGYYGSNSNPRISDYDGLIQQAMYFPTTIEPKNENGDYNNAFIDGSSTYNPMGMIWESHSSNKTVNNRLQGYVQFDIMKGLTFRSQFGVTFENKLNRDLENNKSYYAYKNGNVTQAYALSYWNTSWLNTNTLSYIKDINKDNRINATAVFEQSYSNNYNHRSTANGLDFADLLGWNALDYSNSSLSKVASENVITTLMSGLFRVNYVYKNRYMLTASLRADGSSRLKEKWQYFPSAAIAWDMKQENFLKDVSAVDQLKVRVGYGSVGNQAVEAYRIYSKMSSTTNADGTTSYVVDRPSADYLKWERNNQFDVGVDLSLYNGRLRINADWYDKLSKDVLLELAQPVHMGYASLLQNSTEIKNTGIEFTISADPIVNKEFNWHTDLTLSHNKGTFEKIPTFNHRQQQAGNYANVLFQMIEGKKLGSFWGYTFAGIWQQDEVNALYENADGQTDGRTNGQVYKVVAGNSKYVDVNKDGKYNDADQGVIGCGQPTFNWGWNNTFTYKNFDLSFFFVGFHGFDIYNATDQMGFNTVPAQNFCFVTPKPELRNHWTPTNTNTNVRGFVKGGTENSVYSTRFVENGSFVKMKSITLGYTFPKELCNMIGINNFRMYVSAQNLFHITSYSGLDPEATLGTPLTQGVDWAAYPNGRNFLVGLNFSF